MALESFWNGWACLRKDILLIVCGSATSWIVEKVLRNRGGLYNLVTVRIPVAPFTLAECEEYAKYKHLGFNRMQIAECYMAFGGVAARRRTGTALSKLIFFWIAVTASSTSAQ